MPAENTTSRERAVELLGRMTLAEKVAQLVGIMPMALLGANGVDTERAKAAIGDGLGHISMIAMTGGGAPAEIATLANSIQRFLVTQTRLGIPAIAHNEALNGFVAPGYTSFPTAIGLAATWDEAGIREMTDLIRRQMRSVGTHQALSPVMDISRDARWGRVHETYGEDVCLASTMSVAFTEGLQGTDLREGVIATAKHFLGYGAGEAGQNMAASHIPYRELRDVYAAPFEAAIRHAGLASVMNSYSEIDGIPVVAAKEILTDLLRDELGFTGTVVSDYMAVSNLFDRQDVAPDLAGAGVQALTAGLDVELPNPAGYAGLAQAVADGRLDEALIDQAVLRVLIQKFDLGLFENPYVPEDAAAISTLALEGRDLSRRLAAESLTLLKNDGALPLSDRAKRIAVVGPHANDAMAGFAAYTHPASMEMMRGMAMGTSTMAGMEAMGDVLPPELMASMSQQFAAIMSMDIEDVVRRTYGTLGLADAIREACPGAEVVVAEGTGVTDSEPQDIEAAVAAATGADVVVLALGSRPGWFGAGVTEGEGTDTASIELPECQVALTRAVVATGTRAVGVVHMGRAHALSAIEELLPAILLAYVPGPEGSRALAEVLFGRCAPQGRLPYTLPRATGQVPIHYAQPTGTGYRRTAGDMFKGYQDLTAAPLYPFGHGLSYTTFDYGQASVSTDRIAADGAVSLGVDVTNTGETAGVEVVQLYASHRAIGITRPGRLLVGFARVELEPGQTKRVDFDLEMAQLAHTGIDHRLVMSPGALTLAVGSSSEDLRSSVECTVTGEAVEVDRTRPFRAAVKVSA